MEVITEAQPRIKFSTVRSGSLQLPDDEPELLALCALMERMERLGAAPILQDQLVGGNAGILLDLPGRGATLCVSRSGKPPGLHPSAADFVAIEGFDTASWSATYRSSDPSFRPTSDTPLLHACLAGDASARHHWSSAPRVALHGHALAAGPGLEAARALGLPISEHETLFSTREDLDELEALLAAHPYPETSVVIRRGHGFFILASDVGDAAAAFDRVVVPELARLGSSS